jgi:hypothetical protein
VSTIRTLTGVPDEAGSIHQALHRVAFESLKGSVDLVTFATVEDRIRKLTDVNVSLRNELPSLLGSLPLSDKQQGLFAELQRGLTHWFKTYFDALFKVQMAAHRAIVVPVEGGGTRELSMFTVYTAFNSGLLEAVRGLQLVTEQLVLLFPPDERDDAENRPLFYTEEIVMGDKFSNISNATIINRSTVENAFNRLRNESGTEIAEALKTVALHVADSGNVAAGTMFDNFAQELNAPAPDKGRLRQFWDGLVAVLPSVASIGEAAAKIVGLFA